MMRPLRSANNSQTLDFSSNYPSLIPRIFIYANERSPFLRIQAPPCLPVQLQFPNHSRHPFVQVQVPPFFYRHFHIQVTIQELERHPSIIQTLPTSDVFPFQKFYMFSICITAHTLTDNDSHPASGTTITELIQHQKSP